MDDDWQPEPPTRPPWFGATALGYALLSLLALVLCCGGIYWGVVKSLMSLMSLGDDD